MRYSCEHLERLAAETGFQPDSLEKVLWLGRFLDQVTRHPFLGDRLALKGGTALNLFFGRVPRLSVDLDFNYVGAVDRDRMLEERGHLERALEQIASGEEYRVQRAAEEHAGRKFFLSYRGGFGTQDRIETDVNFMFRVPLCPPRFEDGWTPDPDSPCRARLVGTEEVMAGKLLALLAPLLNLSPAEREYVERLQWGEFRPELVAGDSPELVERLRIHPGLLWEVENARKRPR